MRAARRPRARLGRRAPALLAALLALAPLAAIAVPGEARAQPVDQATRMTARKLADEALKLFDKGEYAAALEKFELADQLVPAPTLGVRAARCLVQLGRLVEASERYLEVVRMKLEPKAPFQHKRAQVEALQEREKLLPTIPSLVVTVEGPQGKGVKVLLDGKPMPPALLGQERPIDPGKHTVEARREDNAVRRELEIAEGEHARAALKLPPLPRPPPPPEPPEARTYRTAGWIGVGVGGGLLLLGAANGVAALVQERSLLAECPDRQCPPSAHSAANLYDVTRVISSVGLIAGAVTAGAGGVLLVLAPRRPAQAVEPEPAPAAGARGPRSAAARRAHGRSPGPELAPFVTWGGAGVRGIF